QLEGGVRRHIERPKVPIKDEPAVGALRGRLVRDHTRAAKAGNANAEALAEAVEHRTPSRSVNSGSYCGFAVGCGIAEIVELRHKLIYLSDHVANGRAVSEPVQQCCDRDLRSFG